MENKIFVDTCIWVEFFRSKSSKTDFLGNLLINNAIWTSGIIAFELLQGVKSLAEKSKIKDALSGLNYVELSYDLWQKAAELSLTLKKKGVSIPLSDIIIAAIAIENGLQVLSYDKHFEQIPGLQLYKI